MTSKRRLRRELAALGLAHERVCNQLAEQGAELALAKRKLVEADRFAEAAAPLAFAAITFTNKVRKGGP